MIPLKLKTFEEAIKTAEEEEQQEQEVKYIKIYKNTNIKTN